MAIMTLLACFLGSVFPYFLNPFYTKLISGILFTCFGLKMLYDEFMKKPEPDD